jgi:hypothetical protein
MATVNKPIEYFQNKKMQLCGSQNLAKNIVCGTMMRLEGVGALKKINDLIGSRTRDLPPCTVVPRPSGLQLMLQLMRTTATIDRRL